jgi:hypothetical protein
MVVFPDPEYRLHAEDELEKYILDLKTRSKAPDRQRRPGGNEKLQRLILENATIA